MRIKNFPRGLMIGVAVSALTFLLLNIGGGLDIAVAQDDDDATPVPTETPLPTETMTPTPLPTLELSAVTELVPDGDLNGNGMINPGDTVQYSLMLANEGEPSGPVEVVVNFDKSFVSGVSAISEGGTADEGLVHWDLASVATGEVLDLSFQVSLKRLFPPGRTQVTGAALVRAGAVEIARTGIPAYEVDGPSLTIVGVDQEMITDANSNGRIDPGDTVRFTISYQNSGGGPSQEATIVAAYPVDFTREIASNPDNGTPGDGTLSWFVGSVPADDEVKSVQFSVALGDEFPADTSTYDLDVMINGASGVLDRSAASVKVSGPNLSITGSYEFLVDQADDGMLDSGDQLVIKINYENIGTDAASNVVLKASYNQSILEVSNILADGVQDAEAGTITWTLPALDAGVSGEVTFVADVAELALGTQLVRIDLVVTSDTTAPPGIQLDLPVELPTPTVEASPTPEPLYSEVKPAQGSGILGGNAVAMLVGAFLFLSLLSLVFVASRVLPGSAQERAEMLDTEEEQAAHRRMVRELIEGVVLTAILFSVMVLGLQNALDQDSVNSIIAGIVGYVAGRVSSQK
ncbi:MAG: hypothetical protein JXJ17_10440 [Anaerolineae bacterium]|nr:hypothetical protein [Anaerolineae bacterium]